MDDDAKRFSTNIFATESSWKERKEYCWLAIIQRDRLFTVIHVAVMLLLSPSQNEWIALRLKMHHHVQQTVCSSTVQPQWEIIMRDSSHYVALFVSGLTADWNITTGDQTHITFTWTCSFLFSHSQQQPTTTTASATSAAAQTKEEKANHFVVLRLTLVAFFFFSPQFVRWLAFLLWASSIVVVVVFVLVRHSWSVCSMHYTWAACYCQSLSWSISSLSWAERSAVESVLCMRSVQRR